MRRVRCDGVIFRRHQPRISGSSCRRRRTGGGSKGPRATQNAGGEQAERTKCRNMDCISNLCVNNWMPRITTAPSQRLSWHTHHPTSTAVRPKSKLRMDALNLVCFSGEPSVTTAAAAVASVRSVVPSHFDCMYLCFLQGPMCMLLSFMHCLAAAHMTLTTARNRSARATYTSGSAVTSARYSVLARATSNSARKLSSTTTRTALPLRVCTTTST
jgi:hypothetical protein